VDAGVPSSKVVEKLVGALDAIYLQYQAKPRLAESDPLTPTPSGLAWGRRET